MASDDLQAEQPRSRPLTSRLRTLVTVVVLLALGVAARKVWDGLNLRLAESSRYRITAATIHIEPAEQPPWIRTDVKAEVLRDSGIAESLSLLDPPGEIQQRLVDAFELHPWVRQVARVELASSQEIDIQLEYREPVAVVEVTAEGVTELLPVDRHAVRLPGDDFTDVEKAYLPRLVDIEDRPLVGQAWTDERMQGAAELAARLMPVWESYSLLDIVPSRYPDVQRSHRFYIYEIRTSGGTAIRWGAAPGFGPPGESPFDDKLARLAGYVKQFGPLDSIDSPQAIDVRDSLQVERRTVQRKPTDEMVR